jgi:hypothetical protein
LNPEPGTSEPLWFNYEVEIMAYNEELDARIKKFAETLPAK